MSTNKVTYKGNPSINRERTQRQSFLLEEGLMADTDTSVESFGGTDSDDMKEGEDQFPPSVVIFTHDGGYTPAGAETYAVTDGDILDFRFWDPDNANQRVGSAADMPSDGSSTVPKLYTTVSHVIDGVTGGAATAAQMVASLNADAAFAAWAYAALDAAGTRPVVYPIGPRATVLVTGGTGAAAMGFPAVEADNALRTFTNVGPGQTNATADRWDWSWNNGTQTITVTNNTGATVAKVAVRVDLF